MQWLRLQLTHDVSLAATDAFWNLAMKSIPKLLHIRDVQGIKRKIPQFPNQRKILYSNECPKVSMLLAYLNTETNDIVYVKNVNRTPMKTYDWNNKFIKLYESASIQVIHGCPS